MALIKAKSSSSVETKEDFSPLCLYEYHYKNLFKYPGQGKLWMFFHQHFNISKKLFFFYWSVWVKTKRSSLVETKEDF